jgi:hypothetical protein
MHVLLELFRLFAEGHVLWQEDLAQLVPMGVQNDDGT